MHAVFTSYSPVNSRVVERDTGEVLYNITTPLSVLLHETTMYDGRGHAIATYRRQVGPDEITYRGETRYVSDWLCKEDLFSRTRMLTAPNGRKYRWEDLLGRSKFRLVDCETGEVVAEAYGSLFGILADPRNMGIEVSDAGVEILDVIVLSFIILEKERRD
ncbi:hypothetical protein OH77DRAFT_1428382 [Trametes cingulata]|nr:hypothetical protein OH77DRAFT_1428382 [Trametes cingulata]